MCYGSSHRKLEELALGETEPELEVHGAVLWVI